MRAWRKINWLEKKLKYLNLENSNDLNDLNDSAKEKNDSIGNIWLEFYKSLLEINENNQAKLYKTADAAHFFNISSLASGLVNNRMIAAVPGFLTALGVLGTFAGLQFGLSELNLANNVSVEDMKSGVAGVINGAKIAFITSVWGVLLSVLFNFIEKFLEGSLRNKISKLQNKINSIFPYLSAESQLQSIAADGKQARESLQGLAEEIGGKMQESLVQVTAGMQGALESSLQNIIAPAMSQLVDRTNEQATQSAEGNQKVFEELLTKFMTAFGQAGANQREEMNVTSSKINDAIIGMGDKMMKFISKIDASQNASHDREISLVSSISSQISSLTENIESQSKEFTKFTKDQLIGLGDNLNAREQKMVMLEQDRSTKFIEQTNTMVSGIASQVSIVVENTQKQGAILTQFTAKQLDELTSKFDAREQKSLEIEQDRSTKFIEQTNTMVTSIASQVSSLAENTQKQGAMLTQFTEKQLGRLTTTFNVHEQKMVTLEQERNKQFIIHMNEVKTEMKTLLEQVELNSNVHQTVIKQILEQAHVLQENVKATTSLSIQATDNMKQTTQELRGISNNISIFGSQIKDASDSLGTGISQAVKSSESLADQAQENTKIITKLFEELKNVSGNIGSMLQQVESTFSQLKTSQNEFLTDQKNNLAMLTEKTTGYLDSYAEKANRQTIDSLDIWSSYTREYSSQMISAVKAISSVVDEIDGVVDKIKTKTGK
ncbi:hypothetical protein AwWohl_06140 [Gammaproteobacteria bacterium]|nr:hypothetical protein AwWohl_06140 [Gammaproteobacteria bacterium]